MTLNKKMLGLGSVLALGFTQANAAVSTTAISDASTDIALVGGAVFVVLVGIKVFQWIRRAL